MRETAVSSLSVTDKSSQRQRALNLLSSVRHVLLHPVPHKPVPYVVYRELPTHGCGTADEASASPPVPLQNVEIVILEACHKNTESRKSKAVASYSRMLV